MKKHPQFIIFLFFLLTGTTQAQTGNCPGIQPVILLTNPVCFGGTEGMIDIPNIQNITPPFRIEMGDKMATSLVRFVGLGAGDYTINIEDANGCTFSQTVTLVTTAPFILDLGEEVSVNLGETAILNPTANEPIDRFEQHLMAGDTCLKDCFDPVILPIRSGFYKLSAISENGCIATDSVFITVNPIRKIYIPNIFSPNEDGINDFFTINGDMSNVQGISEVAIFDRWGNLLLTRKNVSATEGQTIWDGKYKKQLVERGAYLYYATILFLDGAEEVIVGTVTVLY